MCAARGVFLLGTLLILLLSPATADDLDKAQSALAALRSDLQSERIARATIFSIPYTVFTSYAVTPERLEVHSRAKQMSVDLSAALIKELIKAIDDTQLELHSGLLDLKWGAVFYDKAGVRIHSTYLVGQYDPLGTGKGGNIGGVDVKLNGSLISWFESNFGTR